MIGRFTLHQHHRGKSSTRYDPLDLYSEEEARMEKALDGLLHDWEESGGKANNLRVFANGKAVVPPVRETPVQAELLYWYRPLPPIE